MLVFFIITWFLVFLFSVALNIQGKVRRCLVIFLSILWGGIVLYLTFGTQSGGGSHVNFLLLNVTNKADVIDAFLNAVMFFPGGMLLNLMGKKISYAIIIGALMSFLIEAMQFVIAIGRTSDLNDIIFNTLGAALGFLLANKSTQAIKNIRGT